MALHTMIARLQESQKQLNAEARKMIAAELGKLLPAGSRLEWDQYTDYFNDGEQCTFSVHEPYLVVEDAMSKHRIDITYDRKRYAGIVSEDTLITINEAWKTLARNEDLFLSAFGDHVSVSVDANGDCETEENSNHD